MKPRIGISGYQRVVETALGNYDKAVDCFERALDVQPGDLTVEKKRFSAFIQGSSDIAAHLSSRGIDTLLIGGTATNICCESTARDAMMLNYKVVMVHDALATYTDEDHNATLRTFYSLFGDVQTVDQAIGSMKRGLEKKVA